jgi:REP element-mobilizing transposase RayT
MVRPLRIQFAGALYHVTARGNARQPIFRDDDDRRAFVENLGRVCERYSWRIWAWCLMDKHFHLLLETAQATLSRGMREVNGVYTQAFNRRHRRVGQVLQGRYKAVLVDKERYLLEVSRYVVLNPVRARVVRSAADWPWSSYRATVGRTTAPDWLASSETLAMFGTDRSAARRAYAHFVAAGVGAADLDSAVRNQVYLGDEAFAERMARKAGQKVTNGKVPRRRRNVKSLAAYAREFADRDTAIAAAWASGAYTQPEIGEHFGLHYSTVSRIARRGDARNKT